MSSGRRITIALVGLVLLVIIGYVVNDLTHHHSAAGPVAVLRPVSVAHLPVGLHPQREKRD
ncbi:MAG TPA: hypothetical protein VGJ45_14845 [Pseudonocardiaceae bacterium]